MPIVDKNGLMLSHFSLLIVQLAQLGIMTGSGTPEGSIEGKQTQLYMDTTGTAGNVLYIKRDADIAGDKKRGWILI